MRVSASQFTQRRLAQNDRSGFPQFFGNKGVSVRIVAFEKDRAERCRHSLHVELVLDNDGDAMKRPGQARALECRIQPVRLFKRLWIDCDDRIDGRPLLVVRVDTFEIQLDQLMRRQLSGLVRVVHRVNGRFLKMERLRLAHGSDGP